MLVNKDKSLYGGARINFEDLLGEILISVEQVSGDEEGDELHFKTVSGWHIKMYHYKECCESVSIEDICGDFEDLVGVPLLRAEESSNNTEGEYGGSETWTFYKLDTINGDVVIRWYGSSNGYYSESVDLEVVSHPVKEENV